jgi:F-type H+-transporting ATPase subunit b
MLANNFLVWWIAQVAAVAILVILFLRWRPGFLGKRTIGETVSGMLDARQAQIQQQLDAAQQSREEAARIQEQSGRDIDRARQEAQEIVARASTTSQAIQTEMEQRAHQEYDRIVSQAKSAIDYEREQAEQALRRRASDIVVDAARQVVEETLDAQADRRIVDDALGDMKGLR